MPTPNQNPSLQTLLAFSSFVVMSPQEKEAQRQSFAYGNTKIENESITHEMVNRVAETIGGNGTGR